MNITDKFGFLPVPVTFKYKDCEIVPVNDFQDRLRNVKRVVNKKDGFIYPFQQVSYSKNLITSKRTKISNSERPAHLFPLPASHEIKFATNDSSITLESLRKDLFGFLIHLLGYIYKTRLQFHNWWFDGRIRLSKDAYDTIARSSDNFKGFLDCSMNAFETWNAEQRRFFINILFMHNRVPSYEWEWERFAIQYMVFDACWKFSGLPRVRHEERINNLCNTYGLYYDQSKVETIVKLRNDLFHEALWAQGTPGSAGNSDDYYAVLNLRKLTQRLIVSLLGYKTAYTKTNWTTLSNHWQFD